MLTSGTESKMQDPNAAAVSTRDTAFDRKLMDQVNRNLAVFVKVRNSIRRHLFRC